MILVDTSVWIDHLRSDDLELAAKLKSGAVLSHPCVIGEIAIGDLPQRKFVLEDLNDLPSADVATDAEIMAFVENHALFGRGLSYIDAHLLASTKLTSGAKLWTRDRRLERVAEALGVAV